MVDAVKFDRLKLDILKKISKICKSCLKAVLIAIFIILLALFGVLLVCWLDSMYYAENGIAKNPLLNAYVVVTESMVPTIEVNDAVVIKRIDDFSIDIGDIITFSSNDLFYKGKTVTHRVVGKQLSVDGKYIYRTKGDNNSVEDTGLVGLQDIYGKVLFTIPKIGYIQSFVSSPFGFVMSIVFPVLFVIVYEVWRIKRVLQQKYNEIEII